MTWYTVYTHVTLTVEKMIEYTLLIRREATLYYYDDVGCVYGFGLQLSHIIYFVIVVAILSSSHRLSLCACFYPCSGPVMN